MVKYEHVHILRSLHARSEGKVSLLSEEPIEVKLCMYCIFVKLVIAKYS